MEDDAYSPHGTGAGERLNEPEGVAFASSRNFRRRSTPQEGTTCTQENFFHVTVGLHRFGIREPNSAEICLGAAEIRLAKHTGAQTD